MEPTYVLMTDLLNAMAADASSLAPAANANEVHLIAAHFVPGPDTALGDLTVATFNGSTPIDVELGAQQVAQDPLTGERFIQLIPPVGGFFWECGAAPAAPETIYGICVTTDTGAVTLGSAKLPQPVTISDVGDSILVDKIRLTGWPA